VYIRNFEAGLFVLSQCLTVFVVLEAHEEGGTTMGWKATDLFLEATMVPAFGMPAAANGTRNIFWRGFTEGAGGDGTLWNVWWNPSTGQWFFGGELTAGGAPPVNQFTRLAAYYFAEQQTLHIAYIAGDLSGNIIEFYGVAPSWYMNNLSISAGDAAQAVDGPSGFALQGLAQVFFRGTDQHVHELFWDSLGWHAQDLTNIAGGPLCVSAPAAYGFAGQSTQHVVYVAPGAGPLTGPVHELWRDSGGNWHDGGNLTTIAGAPLPAVGAPAGYAFEAEFTQHVFYRGTDDNIYELRWAVATNGWHYWGSPTELTSAPLAAGDPAGYVFDAQNTEHVAYRGVDGHIHELWRISGGAWSHNDLTARTGAPTAATDPIGYLYDYFGGTQNVAYTSADRHVIELSWEPIASNPQFVEDVDGDGIADIVAFGVDGVWTARGKGDGTFDWPRLATADFGYDAGGWRVEKHVRLVGDITGDALNDIVGFGEAGVLVALSNGDGTFGPTQLAVADLGYDSGWRVDRHPRFLADLRNKGRKDIVGFGNAGVFVALSNGDGTFAYAPVPVLSDFCYDQGWRMDRHVRYVVDLRGIGIADIIGFFDDGVRVALGDGNGGFGTPQLVLQDFGYSAGGWRVDMHPRFLADLSGTGVLDIVGFGNAGVLVALGNGDGTFQQTMLAIDDFGYYSDWRVDKHPRLIADVTGDGKADIVGFGNAGVFVAVSQGGGMFSYTPSPVLQDFSYDAGGWRVIQNPRFLARVGASPRADIVGFGNVGVRTALSTANGGFGQVQLAAPDFGYWGRPW
jgi:hypothetical protein